MIKKITHIAFAIILSAINIVYADNLDSDNQSDSKDPVATMLMQSMDLIGIPYKWGGNTPSTGLDCSGFIRYVYKKSLGITLPRTAAEMARLGKNIPIDNLKPGDLLFFSHSKNGRITHVGMYIGDDQFIQAPETGQSVKISEFSGYYLNNFRYAKRMVQTEETTDGNIKLVDYHNQVSTPTTKTLKSQKKYHKNLRSR